MQFSSHTDNNGIWSGNDRLFLLSILSILPFDYQSLINIINILMSSLKMAESDQLLPQHDG